MTSLNSYNMPYNYANIIFPQRGDSFNGSQQKFVIGPLSFSKIIVFLEN